MAAEETSLFVRKRCLSPDSPEKEAKKSHLSEDNAKDDKTHLQNLVTLGESSVHVESHSVEDCTKPEGMGNPDGSNENLPSTSSSNLQQSITEDEINELIEGLGDDIDTLLDEKAEKNKLTIKNVKSILKHVITNKYVLAMVRNTMRTDISEECDLEEAVFEPKLTRSKAKELREKQADLPWPVSAPLDPRKEPVSKKLLTEEFSDDEGSSDEEYRPQMFRGEKCPKKKTSTSDDVDENRLVIFDPSTSRKKQIDRIALRTRSKLPLTDTPLEKIEASFVAPDFTFDMYDTLVDDDDWQKFLMDFNNPLDDRGSSDQHDDENDPEYNIMDDHEEEEEEEEEVENDGEEPSQSPADVLKEEMNALMSEMLVELIQIDPNLLEQQPTENQDQYQTTEMCPNPEMFENQEVYQNQEMYDNTGLVQEPPDSSVQVSEVLENSVNSADDSIVWIQPHERLQLEEQMRTHTQLLCQTFLLSYGIQELSKMNLQAEAYLKHIKHLASLQDQNVISAFQTFNLDEAISIVNILKFQQVVVPPVSTTKQIIPYKIREIMAQSQVFLYPELLPTIPFQTPSGSNKIVFPLSEDKLIVLGLDQFQWSDKPVDLIQQYLVPTKTVQQIKFRIKNRKTIGAPEGNPIKLYAKNKELPFISRDVRPFDPLNVLTPCQMKMNVLPTWVEAFHKKSKGILLAPQETVPVLPPPPPPEQISLKFVKPITRRKYSPILPHGYVSPLKKITPILKKYGHHRRVHMTSFHMTSPSKHIAITKSQLRPLKPKPEVVPLQSRLKAPLLKKKVISSTNSLTLPNHDSQKPVETVEEPKCDENINVTVSSNLNEEAIVEKEVVGIEVDAIDDVEEDAVDDEQDLAALMAASSTICRKTSMMKKKNKQQRDLESTLVLLGPNLLESDPKKEDREKHFAQLYLCRVFEALKNEPEQIEKFLLLLCSYENSTKTSLQLFAEVNEILKDFPSLANDFVGFLLPEEARDCGKYPEYIMLYKTREFLRKIEVHFMHQPQHVQRILRTLAQLQQQPGLTTADVIAALQPLLRNQSHLLEEFIQLLPDGTPPDCLMTDFEEIHIPNSDCENSCDSMEEIVIPETKDPYGGKDCPCECHVSVTDPRMQSRSRHCVECGIKFFDGRIYIQTGKVLKPAQVVYSNPKLGNCKSNDRVQPSETKADSSSSSLSSLNNGSFPFKATPSKSFSFDVDSEKNADKSATQKLGSVQGLQKKSPQTDFKFPNISRNVSQDNFVSSLPCDVNEDAILFADSSGTASSIPSDFSGLSKVISPKASSFGHSAVVDDGNIEVGCPKQCPPPKESVPSSTPSAKDGGNKLLHEQLWTRDQDRIILETCQKHGINDDAFNIIAKAIPSKTLQQLQNRFNELMNLVKKHLSGNR